MSTRPLIVFYTALSALTGCTASLFKQEVMDHITLGRRLPENSLLQTKNGGELTLSPGEAWLSGIKPQ